MIFLLLALFCFVLIAYTYFGYPLLLWIWVKAAGRAPHEHSSDTPLPKTSVIVTVHNAEKLIRQKLENLNSMVYRGELEINFVLDGCTDRTEEEIESAKRDLDLKFPVRVHSFAERRGKEPSIRRAIDNIEGPILMFSDADAIMTPTTIQALATKLMEPDVGVACGREVHITDTQKGAGQGQGLFYRYEEFIKSLQEKVGSLTYVQGGVFAMWKSLYPEEIKPGATQDGVIAFNTVRNKKRVALAHDTLSTEPYNIGLRADFDRRIRTISRAFYAILSCRYIFNPIQCASFGIHVLSSRILRWLTIPLAIAGTILLTPVLATEWAWIARCILASEILFLLIAAGGFLLESAGYRSKIPYIFFYFTYIHFAAFVAVIKVLAGARTITWRPTQTI